MVTEQTEVRGAVDAGALDRTASRLREARIALPRFAELADPTLVPAPVRERLAAVGPDEPHALNLFRKESR